MFLQHSNVVRNTNVENCTSHATYIDVGLLQKSGVKETTYMMNKNRTKRNISCHIIRNTSGHYGTLLTTIEGRLNGKRGRGRPRRTWGRRSQRLDLARYDSYDQLKRAAEFVATHISGRNNE